jgi:hypothetical protein
LSEIDTEDTVTPVTDQDESIDVGGVFAERMRFYRRLNNSMTMKQLSQACAELGGDLSESSLVNLERTAALRRRVTVEDWLIIAAALRVPPLALLIPASTSPVVRLVPSHSLSTSDALSWLENRNADEWEDLDGNIHPATQIPGVTPQLAQAVRTLSLLREHGACLDALTDPDSAPYSDRSGDGRLPGAAIALARIREEMESRGEVPPALSPKVEAILLQAQAQLRREPARRGPVPRATGPSVPRIAPTSEDSDG